MQERESISEISKKYGIHPNMISRWKKEFLDRAPELFDKPGQEKKGEVDIEKFYAKIGQLKMEREFKKKLKEVRSVSERFDMVKREERLSIRCQCKLVSVSRSSFYYKPLGESEENLNLMRLMDEHYLEHPTEGVKRMCDFLLTLGILVNHKYVDY